MSIRIHPSIGVARLGNSPEGKLLVPNKTGGLPHEYKQDLEGYDDWNQNIVDAISFKDELGRIKRQGQPFRIYDKKGVEITLERDDIESIEWTVHLVNKKAEWYDFDELKGNLLYKYEGQNDEKLEIKNGDNSYKAWQKRGGISKRNANIKNRKSLWIDFGPRRISGKNQHASFDKKREPKLNHYKLQLPPEKVRYGHTIEKLGDIETDNKGRLIVFGGRGYTGGNTDLAGFGGGDAWHDDVSDGIVLCRVTYMDKSTEEAQAWCIVGSPDFAPEIVNITTLSDSIFDVYVRNHDLIPSLYKKIKSKEGDEIGQFNPEFKANYSRDIKPIFDRMKAYQWLANVQPMTSFADQDFNELNLNTESAKIKRKKIYQYFRGIDPFTRTPITNATPFIYSKSAYKSINQNDQLKTEMDMRDRHPQEACDDGELPKQGYPQEYLFSKQNDQLFNDKVEVEQIKDGKTEKRTVEKEIVKIGDIFPLMPLNSGTNSVRNENPLKFMALTETQMFLLRQWADGEFEIENKDDNWDHFVAAELKEGSHKYFDNNNLSSLGNCIGLPMSPGIEVTWSVHHPNIYDPQKPFTIKIKKGIMKEYDKIFNKTASSVKKIKLLNIGRDECEQNNQGCEPGDLTKRMACPWQADFINCTVQPINFTNPTLVKDYIYNEFDANNYNYNKNSSNKKLNLKSENELDIIGREVTPPVYYSYWWPASSPWDTLVGDFTKEAQAKNGGIESGRQMNYQRGINSYNQMVEFWDTLSFVRNVNYKNEGFPYFVEMERNHEFFASKKVTTLAISHNKLDSDVETPIFYIDFEKANEKRFEQYKDEITKIKDKDPKDNDSKPKITQSNSEVSSMINELIDKISFNSFNSFNSNSTTFRNRR